MLWISLSLPQPLAACPGLHARLLRYTPRLALLEPQAMALDITGSLQLFDGPRALWRSILQACPAGTCAGMAPTAWGATLLTRHGRGPRRFLRLASLRRRMDRLPCALLAPPPAAARLLDDWGCHTLGQLRRLPRAGLAQRGLAELLAQVDRAYRPEAAAIAWLAPPLAWQAFREPHFHDTSLDSIETALVPLLEDLCHYLQGHQAATDRLDLVLHHDPGRCPVPETRLVLAFSRPQWEAAACLRLCRLRIQAAALPGPVHGVTLYCPQLQPRQPLPASLLPDSTIDRQREDRLLDILRARLGPASIRFARLQDWPLPEQAEAWAGQPGVAPGASALAPGQHAPWPGSRPFWLLPAPVPLDTRQDLPAWQGRPLTLVSGPERLEGGWWRTQNTRRDYFVACDARAACYWVYHDLKAGGWFLHGLFS